MKKDTTNIKAILFDLGNVIVKFDPAIAEEGYSKHGKIEKNTFVDYIMDPGDVDRYMEGKLSSSKFYTKTRNKFRLDIGFKDFYEIWNSIFYPYPEMEEIVKNLKEKFPDIRLVLVSNTNEKHFIFLKENYSVLGHFDEHVLSHEVGLIKPKPGIFKQALRVGDSLAKETLYFDDRQDLIDAARIMGIKAFLFTDHKELKQQLARFNITV
ncbi:MAG: HAD family phosphatase [Candidatus Omnitrophota bacterium]